MDRSGEVVLNQIARFSREFIRHQTEFVNTIPSSGAQQACCFGDDGCLLTLALHRQDGFTINHARLGIRQASLFCTANEALVPMVMKVTSNNSGGVFITLNPDLGMRISRKGEAGDYAETGAKFDYIIAGLDV